MISGIQKQISGEVWWLGLACGLVCTSLASGAQPIQVATQPAVQATASQPVGQAAITVDAAEHDFGSLRAGDRVEHRFKVTNSGSGELQITNVKTNCGCTVAGAYPKILAPGASGELPLALSTTSGPWAFELVEKEAGKRFELTASFNPKGLKPRYVRQAAQLLSNVQAQHQITGMHVYSGPC